MAQVISMTLFAFFLFGNNCANQGEASSKNNIGIEQTGVSQSTVRNEATRNSTKSMGVAFSGNRFQPRVINQGDSDYVYGYYYEYSYYEYDYGNYYELLPNTQIQQIADNNIAASRNDSLFVF
eukprot:TRINITY_DN254_c0_g1_i4.p4 TRINITY_DN254_c0_g1~~TRINITY_DN254_c0_g1_i4.p4  ORF type:complete len:123 (-),score=5.17 TRINITY_DN254_c0_g1_i4:1209-1577(-)